MRLDLHFLGTKLHVLSTQFVYFVLYKNGPYNLKIKDNNYTSYQLWQAQLLGKRRK